MDKTKTTPKCTRNEVAKATQQTLAAGARELQATVREVVKGKVGQPTIFTEEKWNRILEAVASYGDLIEVCQAPDMPSHATLYRWMKTNPELKEDMREAWHSFSMIGHSVNNNILRGGVLSTGDFRRDEALANQNRWFMAKTNRRDFGDKVQIDHVQHQPVIVDWNTIEGEGGDGV